MSECFQLAAHLSRRARRYFQFINNNVIVFVYNNLNLIMSHCKDETQRAYHNVHSEAVLVLLNVPDCPLHFLWGDGS